MNYDALFRTIKYQVERIDELLIRIKIEHTNIKEMYKMIDKILKKLEKK
jgi:hypothetical protein